MKFHLVILLWTCPSIHAFKEIPNNTSTTSLKTHWKNNLNVDDLKFEEWPLANETDVEELTIEKLYENAAEVMLTAHNFLRVQHGVPPLTLNSKISRVSQLWAETLAQERKTYRSPNIQYGENLYSEKYLRALTYPSLIVHYWYSAVRFYKNENPLANFNLISNFTQIIWKSTERLGMGYAFNEETEEVYVVCNYDPPGNIISEFDDNIIGPISDLDGKPREHIVNFAVKYYTATVILRFITFNIVLILGLWLMKWPGLPHIFPAIEHFY